MTRHSDKQLIDAEILALLRTRRRKGYELLFHAYYEEVCQHIYRIHPDASAAEDIAQEIFIELWNKRSTLQIETSPGAYLRRMAVTRTLNYLRDNKHHRHDAEGELRSLESSGSSALDVLAFRDLDEWLTQSINQLPERCRQVFVLSRFEQMSYREIAKAMQISPKTVENQMTKALKHLRSAYLRFQERGIGDHQ
ncbi:MAG: RNA polymerase sigma-70 factor [Saprospiraceae bacterium]|nr:RNA polymerase sigma-70 factor [Saprospiraceae bacterium]